MKVPESKVLPFTHVVADLLGIPRYFACTMPSNLLKKRAQNKERYIQNRQRRKEAARAASCASNADPKNKRAASCARYKAYPDKKRAARRVKYRLNPEKEKVVARMQYVKAAAAKIKWYRKYHAKHRGCLCASRRSRYALAEPRPVANTE